MSGVSVGGGVNTTTSRDIPRILAQSGTPFILAGGTAGGSVNQFTMGDNGAISTLPAALPNQFSSGAWMYMPADAIATSGTAGRDAGWYWYVGANATSGTLYNNMYTGGTNTKGPATPTPFVTTGPGLVTQTTGADIAAFSYTLPGGALGPNGILEVWWLGNSDTAALNKIWTEKWGSTAMWTRTRTTTSMENPMYSHINAGVANKQICDNQGQPGSSLTSGVNTTSIDTSANVTVSLCLHLASAASTFQVLRRYRAVLMYGA